MFNSELMSEIASTSTAADSGEKFEKKIPSSYEQRPDPLFGAV